MAPVLTYHPASRLATYHRHIAYIRAVVTTLKIGHTPGNTSPGMLRNRSYHKRGFPRTMVDI